MENYTINVSECPYCHSLNKVKVFDYVNASREPKLKQLVLKGKLHECTCSFCKNTYPFNYDVTYVDSKNNIVIALVYDEGKRERLLKVLSSKEEDNEEFADVMDYKLSGNTVRVVSDERQLAEKALIFSFGYNDIIVEIVKKVVLEAKKYEYPDMEDLIFNQVTSFYGDSTFCFMVVKDGELTDDFIPIGERAFTSTEIEYDGYMQMYDQDDYVVDQQWTDQFLEFVQSCMDQENYHGNVKELNELLNVIESEKEDREKAEYIVDNLDKVLDILDEDFMIKNNGKKPIYEFDETYGYVSNYFDEINILLHNEKKYDYLIHFNERLLNEFEYDERNKLAYHNIRREIIEAHFYAGRAEESHKLLDQWIKEEPDSPYVYGTQIELLRMEGKLDEARQLARKYENMEVNDYDDMWLYDAMSNVYMDLDDAEGKERVKQLIKQYYENRRSKVNG